MGAVKPFAASCLLLLAPIGLASAQVFDPQTVTPANVPLDLFNVPGDLEVTLWAASPMFHNPTNMDIDAAGRIWVAEGVRYRNHHARQPAGDRIVVLEDKNGDGKAESSHTFVQEPGLIAPLGVAVIDNQIVVSQPPDLIVYTDVDRDLKFDAAKGDKREVVLTGFLGQNHDHSLHSVTVGPDGKWYWNAGNCGAQFTDKDGKTWRIAGPYQPKPIGPFTFPHDAANVAGKKSDDGHVYVGGFSVRMNPDGSGVEVIGHNYRNSYEQSVTSFGDVFQNDNDDPPACRVSFVMEYANFGFASNDGLRQWRSDQRPGQTIPVAEWRQEDPGIYPAGDVYGGGSPTGNVFYENGALGKQFEGMFLACEPGRNVVFGYRPAASGAGYKLERTNFVTTNQEGKFAGSDFLGGGGSVTGETRTLFRPSDVAVGPDGALYVSDWYDPRVGGHQDLDETCSGAIYRIAPKGFVSKSPAVDVSSVDGAIAALRSPAVHVRELGRRALVKQGDAAIPALESLMTDENPFVAARAIWILGAEKAEGLLANADPMKRIAAFRTLRRIGSKNLSPVIAKLAADQSPAVRREAALALRDVPFAQSKDAIVQLATGYDGKDRAYLEALGTACTGKEADAYGLLVEKLGAGDPLKWDARMAGIAWRLHPPASVEALRARALAKDLEFNARKQALDALAFINDRGAVDAMVAAAALEDAALKGEATWWLLNRANNDWQSMNVMALLKEKGIYDADKVQLVDNVIPTPDPATTAAFPPMDQLLALKGDPAKGKIASMRCIACHQIQGIGAVYGPPLDGWGKSQTREVIFRSIIEPSADIAHGFDGAEIVTKDGRTIHGMIISNGNPKLIRSMGGLTQTVPKERIKSEKKLDRSLMLSAGQLTLTPQDVADLVAFLKEN